MANLAHVGYQLYALKEGLLVVGSSQMELLNKKSKADIEDILMDYLKDSEEEDVYMDHKLNRGMLG